ncbi:MAG: hypothetical protein CSA39_03780 [Flavobacteriales bacterium]|nr:MAG: hypothetical protein CSA39_03780 [Flavobacteriales bacterium]
MVINKIKQLIFKQIQPVIDYMGESGLLFFSIPPLKKNTIYFAHIQSVDRINRPMMHLTEKWVNRVFLLGFILFH